MMSPIPRTDGASDAEWSIEKILADRAVQTVFQPIVHLASREVTGFEAFTRGPVGSPVEAPEDLLAAAAAVGRSADIDWLCRAAAMQAAAAADLPPSLSWFINAESAGLAAPCPEDLLPAIRQASSDLRVIVEIVDRDIGRYLPEILFVEPQIRRNLWGIAVDDVGVNAASLALLPIIRPDVIKLDMSLVDAHDLSEITAIVDTVNAYAEQTGAIIVAEGVETERQEQLADTFGATYGQGFRFGAPGPLPATVPIPRQVIPLRHKADTPDHATPFDLLAATFPSRQATGADIGYISEYLQQQARHAPQPGVLFADLTAAPVPDEQWQTLREIAAHNVLTIAITNDEAPVTDADNLRTIRPQTTGTVDGRWTVIVIHPHYMAALAAIPRGPAADDSDVFDFAVTHDRAQVADCAKLFLRTTQPAFEFTWFAAGSADDDADHVADEQRASDVTPSGAPATGLLRRAFGRRPER